MKYTFEQLSEMTTQNLEETKKTMLEALDNRNREKWKLISAILFYQQKLEQCV